MDKGLFSLVNSNIEYLRPYLQQDGGDMELVKVEDGEVHLRMLEACKNCGMVNNTVFDGVEEYLKDRIPEIKKVVIVD